MAARYWIARQRGREREGTPHYFIHGGIRGGWMAVRVVADDPVCASLLMVRKKLAKVAKDAQSSSLLGRVVELQAEVEELIRDRVIELAID